MSFYTGHYVNGVCSLRNYFAIVYYYPTGQGQTIASLLNFMHCFSKPADNTYHLLQGNVCIMDTLGPAKVF